MKHKSFVIGLSTFLVTTLTNCQPNKQSNSESKISAESSPKIVGAMKHVMREGQLYGTINLDTISKKRHLYGLGPVEYLTGEIMVVDGRCYKSIVTSDTTMKVSETFTVKAPFFGYANIDNWTEQVIPDSVKTINQLENYIEEATKKYPRPFFFKLTGFVDTASIHIVNLPSGSKVSSPEEAHQGQRNFHILNKDVTLLGFFSTEHQTIFTHHDTYLHIHLITDDKLQMGHLEEINITGGSAKIYLPKL
ncbi:MAG: acetolactate decarboxylase [Bacteroidia bacterium]